MIALAQTLAEGADVQTNSPAPGPARLAANRTFAVRAYSVEGNTVLPPEKIAGVLTNYTGPAVDLATVHRGLNELQLLYHDLGFPTVAVIPPPQRLTNAVFRVQVIEGKLSTIRVTGNHFVSSNNVMRALPDLKTNLLINTRWFQPELDAANANPDRQIYPVLSPGVDPGTTELELQVKDRLPLHGHLEINDKSTPETPLLRLDAALQYNNLWQLDHQIGVEYNCSPQSGKPSAANPSFFDEPAVASYSGYYRLPVHFNSSLRNYYDRVPVDFGYDQVTHRFNLPAASGTPELIVYASRSTSDTGTVLGPPTTVTDTATLDVFSQTGERSPTTTENIGGKFVLPLRQFGKLQSSLSFGIDFKYYSMQALLTNYTTVEQFATNPPAPPVLQYSNTVPIGQNNEHSVTYLPLSLGWSGSLSDAHGTTSFNYYQYLFLERLASGRTNFQVLAGSREAGGNYTALTAGVTREEKLPRDWSILFRANGQWASEPLINNEQFALGGTGGVRGYQEGESYGDTGWRTMLDLRAPAINIGYLPNGTDEIPAELRCSCFMDFGEEYLLDRPGASSIEQWGTGMSCYLTAGQHLDARLTVAWALHDTSLTRSGNARAYFSVGYQF